MQGEKVKTGIKDGHKVTGNKRKQWKFYDKINDIMGNRPSVAPPVVLDTLQDQACASTSSTEKKTSDDEGKEDEEESKDLTGDEEEDESLKETKSSNSVAEKSTSIVKGKGKKRKRAKAEVMEDIMTKAMKTMTDGLKESEKMFVKLEEKHMQFEERMKERDREFQKEMMKMLISRFPSPNPAQYPMYQPYSSQPGYYPNDSV